jgi:hypothetical protein
MSYFQYRSDVSFEEFVVKSLKSIRKDIFPKKFTVKDFKKINLTLDPEILENKFTLENGYYVKIVKQENNYYEFIIEKIPESFNLLFGCELETCMNLDCNGDTYNDFIKSELNLLRNNSMYNNLSVSDYVKTWQTLILFHLQINIIPYLSKAFLKRFRYAYVMGEQGFDSSFLYIDLSNGAKISSSKDVDSYKTLQFVRDSSVKCGDSNLKDKNTSVHCEIVSPILSSLSELKLLYDNIINKTCNYSNSSAGFHVNISVIDQDKTPVKINPIFEMELFKNWYNFEEKYYKEYRGENNFFAQNVSLFVKDNYLVNLLYSKKSEDSLISEEETLSEYGLKQLMYMTKTNDKYNSIYKKSDIILECRVFPSKNDESLLLDYAKKALDVVKNSMSFYIKNYMNLNNQYQYLINNYQEKYQDFNMFDYKGSIKNYNNIINFYYGKKVMLGEEYDQFKNIKTEIEVEEIEHTTFLLIFDNVKIVKKKKTVEGLITGDHHYNDKIKEIDIDYQPTNDYIYVRNYKSIQ